MTANSFAVQGFQRFNSVFSFREGRKRVTALLVTHDVEEAVYLADRVIVIEAGTIKLNLPITLARPRDGASVQFAELKLRILDRILDRQRSQISKSVSEQIPPVSSWQPELLSRS